MKNFFYLNLLFFKYNIAGKNPISEEILTNSKIIEARKKESKNEKILRLSRKLQIVLNLAVVVFIIILIIVNNFTTPEVKKNNYTSQGFSNINETIDKNTLSDNNLQKLDINFYKDPWKNPIDFNKEEKFKKLEWPY